MKINQKRLEKGLWWDKNWGVLEGCSPVSPGCKNCFAANYAHRFQGALPYLKGLTNQVGKFNGVVRFREDQLYLPLRTKKPTVFFVAERSDLFHPAVKDEWRDRIFAVMALSPQHTFMILTKRPQEMEKYFSFLPDRNGLAGPKGFPPKELTMCGAPWPLPNVWLGVTAENQEQADKRIPILLQTPASKRFVSVEPILGTIKLPPICDNQSCGDYGPGDCDPEPCQSRKLHWVICGGESGPNARPIHPDWVRSLRDQCKNAGVPFFLKQWGEWVPMLGHSHGVKVRQEKFIYPDGTVMGLAGKKAAGRLLDGREYLEVPE